MKNTVLYIFLFATVILAALSCDEKTEIPDMSLSVSVSGLPPLDADVYYYRMYLQNGEVYTYVTDITPGVDSSFSLENIPVDPILLDEAQQVLVILSDNVSVQSSPDGPAILAADFSGIDTEISIGHTEAIGDPFRTQSGSYYLYTPSAIDTSEWYRGIWLYDTSTIDTFSLLLPEINEGWVYEGWVEVTELDDFLSIGRWSLNDEDDSADPYVSQELVPFPFPGEDFIENLPTGAPTPLDLRGRRFFITVEPAEDAQPDVPFPIIVLEDLTLGGPVPRQLQQEILIPKRDFPTGTVRR